MRLRFRYHYLISHVSDGCRGNAHVIANKKIKSWSDIEEIANDLKEKTGFEVGVVGYQLINKRLVIE